MFVDSREVSSDSSAQESVLDRAATAFEKHARCLQYVTVRAGIASKSVDGAIRQ